MHNLMLHASPGTFYRLETLMFYLGWRFHVTAIRSNTHGIILEGGYANVNPIQQKSGNW